jgi:DNA repair protein RadC
MKIKDYNIEERPREKVKEFGIKSLSDRELLALVLRSGIKGKSALELADDLIKQANGIQGLNGLEYENLIRINGIKSAKASEICAISELSRRMAFYQSTNVDIVDQPQRLVQWLKKEMGSLKQEHFLVVFLNTKNHIIGYRPLFIGGLDRSIVHPREVFKHAINHSAARIVVVHNHPSGDVTPSENDWNVTQVLEEAGQTMGIPLLDHIIISERGYTSLREVLRKD